MSTNTDMDGVRWFWVPLSHYQYEEGGVWTLKYKAMEKGTNLLPTVGGTWASGLGMSIVTGSVAAAPTRRCRRKSQFSSQVSESTTMSPGPISQHSVLEHESEMYNIKYHTMYPVPDQEYVFIS